MKTNAVSSKINAVSIPAVNGGLWHVEPSFGFAAPIPAGNPALANAVMPVVDRGYARSLTSVMAVAKATAKQAPQSRGSSAP